MPGSLYSTREVHQGQAVAVNDYLNLLSSSTDDAYPDSRLGPFRLSDDAEHDVDSIHTVSTGYRIDHAVRWKTPEQLKCLFALQTSLTEQLQLQLSLWVSGAISKPALLCANDGTISYLLVQPAGAFGNNAGAMLQSPSKKDLSCCLVSDRSYIQHCGILEEHSNRQTIGHC